MQFVIPAWDGTTPGELNVAYSIDLGANVQLHQVLNATKIADLYYQLGLLDQQ